VKAIATKPMLNELFTKIYGSESFGNVLQSKNNISVLNENLNDSQVQAVEGIVENDDLLLLHGPPGTGKTTTLIEATMQIINQGKKVLISAPSNAAVDHLAKKLLTYTDSFLRIGNQVKIDPEIYPYTPEGKFLDSKESKSLKKLKIKAEELRRLSYQYKRNFDKNERAQRNLIIQEVKSIRKEIKSLQKYYNDKLFDKANVVIGTPVGLSNFLNNDVEFDTLIIDEAGQCIEPLNWLIFPFAKSWVLAGDPFQLPPTVLSNKSIDKGYNVSLLEQSFKFCNSKYFLDTQYRMPKELVGFSNSYFYKNELKSHKLNEVENPILFYDTAGTGFDEKPGINGRSLTNEGELSILQGLIDNYALNIETSVLISPYSAQVELAKNLEFKLKVSTIDSFQGQEAETIIIS